MRAGRVDSGEAPGRKAEGEEAKTRHAAMMTSAMR